MKTVQISKAHAAMLLFMTEAPIEVKMTKAEVRALDAACRKLDGMFDEDDAPRVVTTPKGLLGNFGFNGEAVEVQFSNSEFEALNVFMEHSDKSPFHASAGRAPYLALEDAWDAAKAGKPAEDEKTE
jgi:hypothetical protein